mgnify:CR=1 FL=1
MKKSKTLSTLAILLAAAIGLQSCQKDSVPYDESLVYPTALVTVKPDAEGSSFYMQLDEKTVLIPTNISKSPFGAKEVRALVNCTSATENEISRSNSYNGSLQRDVVYVNWMDSVLTKPMMNDLGREKNCESYGNDPVEIVNDWVTIAEDGYLTLRFRTIWGKSGITHYINLVPTPDEDNPYHVTLYHNAMGDTAGEAGDAIVAFRLDKLPDTGDGSVDLVLEWNSFTGGKNATFKYSTRHDSANKSGFNLATGYARKDIE